MQESMWIETIDFKRVLKETLEVAVKLSPARHRIVRPHLRSTTDPETSRMIRRTAEGVPAREAGPRAPAGPAVGPRTCLKTEVRGAHRPGSYRRPTSLFKRIGFFFSKT